MLSEEKLFKPLFFSYLSIAEERCIFQQKCACGVNLLFLLFFQIILLTYGPQRESIDLFTQLLGIWIPTRGNIPSAFMVDDNKEVVLIPDWLKLKMIRSEVPSLVDAALVELVPHQLVLFIQSFGIPVPR